MAIKWICVSVCVCGGCFIWKFSKPALRQKMWNKMHTKCDAYPGHTDFRFISSAYVYSYCILSYMHRWWRRLQQQQQHRPTDQATFWRRMYACQITVYHDDVVMVVCVCANRSYASVYMDPFYSIDAIIFCLYVYILVLSPGGRWWLRTAASANGMRLF